MAYEQSSVSMFTEIKEEVRDEGAGEDSSFEEGLCELPLQVVLTHANEDDLKDDANSQKADRPMIVVIPQNDSIEEGPLREKIVCEEVVVKSALVTVKRHIRVTTQDRAAQTDWPPPTFGSDMNVTTNVCNNGFSNMANDKPSVSVQLLNCSKPSVTVNVVKSSVNEIGTRSSISVPAPQGTIGNSVNSSMRSDVSKAAAVKDSNDISAAARKFHCRCGKAFTRSDHLKQHATTHSDRKQYSCNYCNKTFCRSDILNAHLRWHWGDTPYACEVCGAVFVQASRLSRHRLIHLVHKPFPCDICGMSFARADNLASHIRTHTGEKPFPCPDCGSAFRRADALQRHRRTHTGERPYGCSYCGRGFAAARALRRHERQHVAPEGDLLPGFPYPNIKMKNESEGSCDQKSPSNNLGDGNSTENTNSIGSDVTNGSNFDSNTNNISNPTSPSDISLVNQTNNSSLSQNTSHGFNSYNVGTHVSDPFDSSSSVYGTASQGGDQICTNTTFYGTDNAKDIMNQHNNEDTVINNSVISNANQSLINNVHSSDNDFQANGSGSHHSFATIS